MGWLQVYDFRFAPFDEFATAAAATGRFAGQQPEREPFRTRVLLFPRLIRFTLEAVS